MTKRSSVYVGTVAAAGLLVLCVCSSSSCDSHSCGGQRTLVEKYVGFDANDNSQRVSRCFGPTSDCAPICEDLAIDLAIEFSNDRKTAMMGSVVLCERVPGPDGRADGGYKGWEDAGYVEQLSYDGGAVDPNRILHLIAGVALACGD